MEVQSGISLAYNQSRVGRRERVLVDSFSDGVLVCRSQTESPEVDGEILVSPALPLRDKASLAEKCSLDLIPSAVSPEALIGQFIDVDIVGANEYDLIADIHE
jgi:tRNA A37 methylthiotransferase MiaB